MLTRSQPTLLHWRGGWTLCLTGVLVLGTNLLYPDSTLRLKLLVSELESPVYVTHSGDGTGRLFIVEQGGRIRIHQDGEMFQQSFLDIRDRVEFVGEMGLLGLAFHPQFKENRRFFVNYTTTEGGPRRTVVAEYRASSDDLDVADPNEHIILEFNQPATNHNGGHLAFGRDGFLYIGTGDGGGGGDPHGGGQDRGNLRGAVLRIDVDGGSPYAIPPDNPFLDEPEARDEIWAYGLRNPWRFSFDRSGGRLFLADVGQNEWEEVNVVVRGGNYGWNLMEGPVCFKAAPPCEQGTILPIWSYPHPEVQVAGWPEWERGKCITGGYVYRGRQRSGPWGAYIYGDYIGGQIWALEETSAGVWKNRLLLGTNLRISSFGEDEQGEIYVVHRASQNGSIYQLQFGWREVFAQAADGRTPQGDFRTSVILVNNNDEPVSGELVFRAGDGTPLEVTIRGETAGNFPFELPAKSSMAFATSGQSDPAAVGWAEVLSDERVVGTAVYTLLGEFEEPLGEAGIAASEPGTEFTTHVIRRAAFDRSTAVALANPSSEEGAEVELVVKDLDGAVVIERLVVLEPRHQIAQFVEEMGPLPSDFEGTLVITSSSPVVGTVIFTQRGVQASSLPLAQ